MDQSTVSQPTGGEGSESDKCYICLSPFEKQAVASLEKCHHVFCLECILQWSQTANTCPVDRISFAYIHQRRCPGGDIQKKIKVMIQKTDDEEEEEEEESDRVVCEQCGSSDRTHRLLLCIMCDSWYHMDCLTPPVNTFPEGDWVCPECVFCHQRTEGSVVEEDISDGELTDLLAEVGETASTSTRLRLSTISRPGNSPEQRRSQRLRSRASSGPDPRPPTSRS